MNKGHIKKLYILYILEILKKYSDSDHKLKQQDIIGYMHRDYDIMCERKTVSRNLSDLMAAGYEIEHDSDGYYFGSRDFEDSELRLLIDSVLSFRYIPKKQSAALIEKLIAQSSIHFKNRVKHVYSLDNMERSENNDLFWNLECMGEAIESNKQIAFYYNKYGEDKKLHKTTDKKHLVNPYYIAIANGRYYLVANVDKYDDITHFRIEKINRIEMLESVRKPKESLRDFRDGQGLSKHMLEHVYMFSGESARVVLKVMPNGINDVIDWLGRDVHITAVHSNTEGEYFIVDTVTNKQAIKYWALQFGEKVEILEPEDLRLAIGRMVTELNRKYHDRQIKRI